MPRRAQRGKNAPPRRDPGAEGDMRAPPGEGRRLGRVQLISVVVAAIVSLAGGALWAIGGLAAADAPAAGTERPERAEPEQQEQARQREGRPSPLVAPEQGFLPVEPGEGEPGEPPPEEPTADATEPAAGDGEETLMDRISPAVFRLGFSFLVGFAIAYALRTFVRITLIAAGLLVLALFALQYFGVIDVNWTAMEGHFERGRDWLAANTRTFGDFITGQLPSAASAIGGFAIGLRKRI